MDQLNQIDEADQSDQTNLQPSSVEMHHSSTDTNSTDGSIIPTTTAVGPSVMQLGAQPVRTPAQILPATPNPESRRSEVENPLRLGRSRGRLDDIAVPTREQTREMLYQSYLRLYEAETYGRPTEDPFAIIGHGIHRERQETTNVEMAHPRNADDPLPVLGSPIAFQQFREEGSPPNAGAEAAGHSLAAHVRSEEAAAQRRQRVDQLERLLSSIDANMSSGSSDTSDGGRSDSAHNEPYGEVLPRHHRSLGVAVESRYATVPGFEDARHAQDKVPDLDRKTSELPPSIKTPEQMMVNLECRVCYEQTCNVVLLPCRT